MFVLMLVLILIIVVIDIDVLVKLKNILYMLGQFELCWVNPM